MADPNESFVSAQEWLLAIVEHSDDAIYSKDSNALVTSWNPAARRLYGYSKEEAIGRDIAFLIPPDRRGEEREILARIMAGDQVDHYETRRLCKDGSLVPVSLTVSPVKSDVGEIVGASVIARDVTQQLAYDRLERDIDIQEFVAKVAHELRSPLAVVTGFAEALVRGGDQLPEDRRKQMLESLYRQGERAKRLVQDLLEFSQYGKEGFVPTPEPVELEEVVRSAADAVTLPEHKTLQVEVPSDRRIDTDPMRLEQILINLLGNAVKYGGQKISLLVSVLTDQVCFVVEDDGPGVPEEIRPRLFEPFVRGAAHRAMGTGLGLAISRRLATSLGGAIAYEEVAPSGSRFLLTLPLR